MNPGIEYLSSDLLAQAGVRHGWFMRYGGVSTGLFESLNGKKGTGDSDSNVSHNRQLALNSIATEGKLAHIIHNFSDATIEPTAPGEYTGYDASLTTTPNIVLSQTTADCGTIILSDRLGSVVALVHGSWHTLQAGLITKTVAKLRSHTSAELLAGIGPMICKNCYEFGPEAKDEFSAAYITPQGGKYLVDLKAMIIDHLTSSAVSQIDDVDICTLEDERFFSHRRWGAQSGRYLTLAALPKA